MQKSIEKNPYPKSVPNPQIYLEYNYIQNNNLNEAESKALEQIEYSKKINELKKSKKKEFKKKYNEMALSYQDEQKKKNQEEELIKKAEYLERMQKLQNFNKTLQDKNKKKGMNQNKHLIWKKTENNKSKTKTKINNNNINVNTDNNHNKQIVVINHDNNNANEDVVNLKSMDNNFIPKKTLLKSVSTSNNNEDNQNDIINNVNDIDNFIQKKTLLKSSNNLINNKIETEESKEPETDNNENIIDLRSNLENIINSQYKQNNFRKNNINKEDDIKNQINERMNNLKRFRYEGLFPEKTEPIHKKQLNKFSKSIKNKRIFLSEFEKKRFIKALKNIFTERLGAHDIYIQNICSCGNLQKQLTAIVEKGNLTVYALTEVDCANNCVFYKNKKEYMKNINDVLNSIKNIKYENFHNKYKENL